MTEMFTTENWSFPLKGDHQTLHDPHRDLKVLAKAEGGYYPLGRRGLWHGGIHFDEATGLISDKREVFCLADGEVIAYRIDERYPTSSFEGRSAVFSSGFVLVRHRLQPPPLTNISYAPPAPTLTVYSLYMHLLDWAGYQASPGLRRPTFWGGGVYRIKESAQDKTLGLRVRAAPKNHPDHGVILAVLPRGTTVMTKSAPATDKWLEIVSVNPAIEGLAPSTGWVFKPEMTALGPDRYLIGNAAKDAPAEQLTGLNVRAMANANGNPLGLLPIGTSLTISNVGAVGKFRKLVKILSGECVPPLAVDENGHLPGFVWLDALEANRDPEAKNRVVVLDEPIRIKTGELIGHVGKYQALSEDTARNLLHLEVFSCEDVPGFIARSREYAAYLPADQRTLLKLYKGSSRVVPHREDINAHNPPSINDAGALIGAQMILPVGMLESLPPESKLSVTESIPGTTIAYTRRWWRLEDPLPNESGETVSGWVLEQDLLTTRHSPWEWEGYECITETSRNADNLAHHLSWQADLTTEQRRHYQTLANTAGKGPIRSRLHTLLNIGENEHVGHEAIRVARGKPWHAQAIGRLITHYESEWFWNAGKWDELDVLWAHTGRVGPEQWQISKARIKKLSWWAELTGRHGISLEGKAWHFQPAELISERINPFNFKITLEMLKKVFTSAGTEKLIRLANELNKNLKEYKLDTPLRLSHFFAQVRVETGDSCSLVESLRYRPEKLMDFSYYYQHPTEAQLHGYIPEIQQQANQPAIANRIYNGVTGVTSLGNGNISSGDGWKFRGRGLKQLTGRYNYTKFNQYHSQMWPSDNLNFIENPEFLEQTKYAVRSAVFFWLRHKLYDIADNGDDPLYVNLITEKINFNTNSKEKRVNQFTRIWTDEKIFK